MSNATTSPSATDAVVTLREAVIGHPGAWRIGPFDLDVQPREVWGIVGPNGAGKSTLLRSLVRLHPLLDGSVHLAPAAARPGGVTYVPQRDSLDPVFPVTVLNVVMMGIAPRRGFGRPYRPVDRREAGAALDQVGLRHFAATPFRQLSGGEQQRTLIARALVSQALIMLLDEPTAAMDVDAERSVMDLIRRLAREHGMAVLMVSHGLNAVRRHADKVILLDREQQLIRIGNPREVLGVAMSSQVETFHRTWDDPPPPPPATATLP